jgi:hypothetical protein
LSQAEVYAEITQLAQALPESRKLLYVEKPTRTTVRYVFADRICISDREALKHVKDVLNAGRRFSGVTDA